MYEELVEKLRDDAEMHWHMHPISSVNEYFVDAINQAAEAIEDLDNREYRYPRKET